MSTKKKKRFENKNGERRKKEDRRGKKELTIKVFYTVDECLFIVFVLLVKQRLFS